MLLPMLRIYYEATEPNNLSWSGIPLDCMRASLVHLLLSKQGTAQPKTFREYLQVFVAFICPSAEFTQMALQSTESQTLCRHSFSQINRYVGLRCCLLLDEQESM